jgi:hypothetical protein
MNRRPRFWNCRQRARGTNLARTCAANRAGLTQVPGARRPAGGVAHDKRHEQREAQYLIARRAAISL